MCIEDLKEKLLHLKQVACDDDTQQAANTMLEALEIEADWSEEELQQYCKEVAELENEILMTATH